MVHPVFQNSAIRPSAFGSPVCNAETTLGTFATRAATCAGISSPAANRLRHGRYRRPGRNTTVASREPGWQSTRSMAS
jgi:hypothetical protein